MDIIYTSKPQLNVASQPVWLTQMFAKLLLLLFSVLFSSTSIAAPCDKQSLKKALNTAYGYKERQGICEGLYSSKVSAGFELVSLQETPIAAYRKGNVLRIVFPNLKLEEAIKTLPLNVSGLALRPETYYRMDTQFTNNNDIHWPVNILVADGIALINKDIGIFGWIKTAKTRLLFPVSVVIDNAPIASQSVRMVLRSGAPIQRLNWYLVVNDKRVEKHKLRGGIPAGTPIEIDIVWPAPRPDKVKIQIVAKAHQSNQTLSPIFEIAVPRLTDMQGM